MPSLKSIAENLARAEKGFLDAAHAVPTDQWKTKPGEDRWSAGEVVAHLIMVERAILRGAGKLLQNPPKPRSLLQRFHLSMALVESRLLRRKTPIPLDPRLLGKKEAMLGQLQEVRHRTLAFMEDTKGKNLSLYSMAHPFLGTLNGYEWLQLIASHEVRHTKQMKQIAAGLPKSVATLQK